MTSPHDSRLHDNVLAELVSRIDPTAVPLGSRPLEGGVSAQIDAVAMQHADGSVHTVVVRQHPCAATEYRLLTYLAATAASTVPVPSPYLLDTSGALLPEPFLVMAFVEGDSLESGAGDLDVITGMARALAAIHRVPVSIEALAFLERDQSRIERLLARELPPDNIDHLPAARIRDALAAAGPDASTLGDRPILLHGDFWPGNILWHNGSVRAILDWEDANLGNPLRDLANLRLELYWAAGEQAMRHVTVQYAAQMHQDAHELTQDLARWDLLVALKPMGAIADWGLEPADEAAMRQAHHEFVEDALCRLAG
jgi:aminoglycoside phosphotransferase (APT) family kinase protein